MRRVIFVGLISFLVSVQPVEGSTLLARNTAILDKTTFEVDITNEMREAEETHQFASRHREKWPNKLQYNALRIKCIKGCRQNLSYYEETIDSNIGVFRLRDDSKDIITIWASGSSYWVRVYHISDSNISKVMDAATKTSPQFSLSADGKQLIILMTEDDVDKEKTGEIWRWDGTEYVRQTE
jgi:hypothetical protein